MRITRRKFVVGIFFIFFFSILLQKNRNSNLPTGKITETNPVDISSINPSPLFDRPKVEINTSKGPIIIELRPDLAPDSVINFLSKWANNFCVDTKFHRVEDWMVQACDPEGTGFGGKNILPTENSTERFLTGSVGVARKPHPQNISNDSQFFIIKTDSRFLDGEYTYLGKVTSGMETVGALTTKDIILSTTILTK